jgi:histone H3/H4
MANSKLTAGVAVDYYGGGGDGGERCSSEEWDGWALPRKAFERLVRAECREFFGSSFDLQFESETVFTALQVSVEGEMHTILRGAALAARHAGRDRLWPMDVQLARRLLNLRN